MRYFTMAVAILLGFSVGLSGTVGAADAPAGKSGDQSPAIASKPPSSGSLVYNPPKRGVPGGRVGGGTRGGESGPVMLPLAPDHVGLTTQTQPTLYWYLSKPTNYPIEFTLVDVKATTPILERRLSSSNQAGIQAIRLADYGISLVPGVTYRWYVSLIYGSEASSRDLVAGGAMEVAGGTVELVDQAEARRLTDTVKGDQVQRFAEAGLWYDAINAVSDQIQGHPQDRMFRMQRASLLEQVGLREVAEYEARQ